MRSIRVFVIRLLLDSHAPQNLRGSVMSVLEDKPHPFADGESLLNLLRQMAQSALENQADEKIELGNQDENSTEEKT